MKRYKNSFINRLKNKYNRIAYKNSIDNIEKGNNSLIETKKYNNKSNKYIIIIISFLFILILSSIVIKAINYMYKKYTKNDFEYKVEYQEEEDEDDNDYKPDNITIYKEEKFYSYQEAYNKAKEFLKKSAKGILLNTEKVELSEKPNVSVVIPCCNCEKHLLRAIRTIQNQDLSNFEIVIVNDGSKEDTAMYLKQLQKEENRIRILSNKVNKGTLYTRSIGALSANGKYIFPMDSDDMFLDKDVFSVLTNIAYKGNFDIVIFNSVETDLKPDIYTADVVPSYFDFAHKPNLVLFQPELGYYVIAPSDTIENVIPNDILLHGKLVKTKIYKKAIKKLGKERYSRFMINAEDDLANYIIFNTAKSAKFISKYGYIYINNDESFSKLQKNETQNTRTLLYVLDSMIDFSFNLQKNKKVLIHYLLLIFQRESLKDVIINEYDNKLLKSCLDRILNCKYISDDLKNEVRVRGKNLTYIKYKF